MAKNLITSPFPLPQGAEIYEYPDIQAICQKLNFNDGLLNSLQAQFAQQATYGGTIELFTPTQEPEFGIYIDSLKALRNAPSLFAQNPNSTISNIADRNYQYITFAIAHKNPGHPLNHDYMMQWRVEVELTNEEITPTHTRFCIKSRDKTGLMRDEWETDMEDFNVEKAIQKVIAENAKDMPKGFPAELIKTQNETFVSGHSATSRSGYNGFQWRPKWQSFTLHNFSSDFQIVGSKKGPIAHRLEIEDEVRAAFGNKILLTDDFERVAKGALDIHRGKLIRCAKQNQFKTMKSSLSKAAFAESATQGIFDDSSIRTPGWENNVIPLSVSRNNNYQVADFFSNPELTAGLILMLQGLPEKGSIFSAPEQYPDRKVA